MPKVFNSSFFSQSHIPSIPVTIAVEYKDPAMHRSSRLPGKVIQDFVCLGLPRPSPVDVHDSIGDWVEIHLTCKPFELRRLKLFELSQERAVADLKDRCGIKRMWRLARSPYKPMVGPSLKRPFANSSTGTDVIQKRKKTGPDPPLSMTSTSESDPASPPSVTSSQERLSATDSPMLVGPLERPQTPAKMTGISREQETPDDVVLPRMLPLDQSKLPQSADGGDDPVEESSTDTRDPRRSGLNCYAFTGESTGSQDQNGYPVGTQLLLVDTFEKHPCGWEMKLRRLLQRDQRRRAELEASTNKQERDAARRRIESLENELQEMRQLVREIQTESEMRKAKNLDLEAKIEDIRRECEHPFIVPSLIDVFLKMGDLSGALMQD